MKLNHLFLICATVFFVASCGGGTETSKDESLDSNAAAQANDPMANKGIGPITQVTLGADVDAALAEEGKKVYDQLCTACHKPTEKFIGPAPQGIFDRRSPEWVMNMILNPVEMVEKDPDAKALLIEFNGAPMANQNLTQEQARAVLEYFRTL